MKKRIGLWVGLGISVFCLYLAFRGLSLREIWNDLKMANPMWIAISLLIYVTGYWFRTLRWQVLLEPVKSIPASQLAAPLILGFFANNILPFRMGEFVRAHVTGSKFKISRTASLATIVNERICDILSLLIIFVSITFYLPFPENLKRGVYLLGAACFILILGLILLLKYEHLAHALVYHLPIPEKWKPHATQSISNFAHGASALLHLSYALKAMAFSLVIWSIEGTTFYLMAKAFPVHIHYFQAYFVLCSLALAVIIPQAPGYVGGFEICGVAALSLLGIPREQGLPIILTLHGTQFLLILLMGYVALWSEGWSLKMLLQENETL